MPYDLENPPEKLRGLSLNKQKQWIYVHQSCMDKHGDDIKCQKMAWGTTHGWRKDTEKGISGPDDIDRDVLLELECADIFTEVEVENRIADQLGLEIELKEIPKAEEKIQEETPEENEDILDTLVKEIVIT